MRCWGPHGSQGKLDAILHLMIGPARGLTKSVKPSLAAQVESLKHGVKHFRTEGLAVRARVRRQSHSALPITRWSPSDQEPSL